MTGDQGFAQPPFKASEALAMLKRQMRDLKLAERGNGFELRGQAVVELVLAGDAIDAGLAKRPQRTPEWSRRTLRSGDDVRAFVDAVKQQLRRWSAADE